VLHNSFPGLDISLEPPLSESDDFDELMSLPNELDSEVLPSGTLLCQLYGQACKT
jgi:hypothetical protein